MAQVSEPTPAATNLGPGKVLRVLNIKLTSFLLVITVLGSFFMDQYQDFFNRILIFGRSGSVLRNKNSIRIQ